MNWQDVFIRISDLPRAYRREDPVFAAWETSLVSGLAHYTEGADGLLAQTVFANASGRWLDVWGQLYGVVRNSGEADVAYRTRLLATLSAWVGTVPAISAYILLAYGFVSTVTEAFPAVGWNVNLPNNVTNITQVAQSLVYVRPAGVPFSLRIPRGGMYLSTVNYLGRARTTGAYIRSPYTSIAPNIASTTNNSVPTLATTFLTDPTLNG